jgi:hypothetical protein
MVQPIHLSKTLGIMISAFGAPFIYQTAGSWHKQLCAKYKQYEELLGWFDANHVVGVAYGSQFFVTLADNNAPQSLVSFATKSMIGASYYVPTVLIYETAKYAINEADLLKTKDLLSAPVEILVKLLPSKLLPYLPQNFTLGMFAMVGGTLVGQTFEHYAAAKISNYLTGLVTQAHSLVSTTATVLLLTFNQFLGVRSEEFSIQDSYYYDFDLESFYNPLDQELVNSDASTLQQIENGNFYNGSIDLNEQLVIGSCPFNTTYES